MSVRVRKIIQVPQEFVLTQSISELIVAQKCELVTRSASAFSPFYLPCSHTATFPYFSLLLPNSYRILVLSRSHYTASTYCHFLISLTVRPQTPTLSLISFQSRYLYQIAEYTYSLCSRIPNTANHLLLAICTRCRSLFFAGCCWFLDRHQIANVHCQVIQPRGLGDLAQATVTCK